MFHRDLQGILGKDSTEKLEVCRAKKGAMAGWSVGSKTKPDLPAAFADTADTDDGVV